MEHIFYTNKSDIINLSNQAFKDALYTTVSFKFPKLYKRYLRLICFSDASFSNDNHISPQLGYTVSLSDSSNQVIPLFQISQSKEDYWLRNECTIYWIQRSLRRLGYSCGILFSHIRLHYPTSTQQTVSSSSTSSPASRVRRKSALSVTFQQDEKTFVTRLYLILASYEALTINPMGCQSPFNNYLGSLSSLQSHSVFTGSNGSSGAAKFINSSSILFNFSSYLVWLTPKLPQSSSFMSLPPHNKIYSMVK